MLMSIEPDQQAYVYDSGRINGRSLAVLRVLVLGLAGASTAELRGFLMGYLAPMTVPNLESTELSGSGFRLQRDAHLNTFLGQRSTVSRAACGQGSPFQCRNGSPPPQATTARVKIHWAAPRD